MAHKDLAPEVGDGGQKERSFSSNSELPINSQNNDAVQGRAVRERLPDRRESDTFEINVSGRRYKCSVSYFSDGRLGEIFLSNNKSGSDSDCAARDSAVVASIALQYSVPLDVIRKALMRDSQGRPNGPLGVALDAVAARSSS